LETIVKLQQVVVVVVVDIVLCSMRKRKPVDNASYACILIKSVCATVRMCNVNYSQLQHLQCVRKLFGLCIDLCMYGNH